MDILLKYFSDFTNDQLDQYRMLASLYKEWNEKINVISRKDIESLYEKHVLHSLSIAAAYNFEPGIQLIDLGTGGGFPGIPLAIFFPEVQFHLVDSIGKKIKVVSAVAEALKLKNVTAQHTRAEEIKNRQFDIVLSRAVAPLKDLWFWSKPLLKRTSFNARTNSSSSTSATRITGLISLKGGDLAQEIFESNCRPNIINIHQVFEEEYFRDKFILNIF